MQRDGREMLCVEIGRSRCKSGLTKLNTMFQVTDRGTWPRAVLTTIQRKQDSKMLQEVRQQREPMTSSVGLPELGAESGRKE